MVWVEVMQIETLDRSFFDSKEVREERLEDRGFVFVGSVFYLVVFKDSNFVFPETLGG